MDMCVKDFLAALFLATNTNMVTSAATNSNRSTAAEAPAMIIGTLLVSVCAQNRELCQ